MASTLVLGNSYFGDIWRKRFFWLSLVGNDIVHRYRRSVFGIGWSLLRPLSMTAVFCVVFGTLFNQPIEVYAPHLLLGLAIWQYMHESIVGGAMCFTNSASYIRQQKVPLAIFSARTVLASGFHFLIGFTLAIAVLIVFKGIRDPIVALAVLPGLLLLFVFCWAAATVVGLVQAHFRDASHLLEIGMQIAFYLTPIMYTMECFPNHGQLLLVLKWNPFSCLLQLIRQPLVEGVLPPVSIVIIAVGFTTLTVLLARAGLRRFERTLVFWL